jgi:transcriptional regulator GlxA family with amidase domain
MKKLIVLALILVTPVLAAAQTEPAAAKPVQKTVVVLIYDGVGLGDFANSVEILTLANELGSSTVPFFDIHLAAEKAGPVHVNGGPVLQPDCVLAECPPADLLIVPGGRGSLQAVNRPELIDWIRRQTERSEVVMAICTGSFLLAKAGVLDGISATTHQQGLGYLRYLAPKAKVVDDQPYVDAGKIITVAATTPVFAASLHLIERLLGPERATITAQWLQYDWKAAAPPAK